MLLEVVTDRGDFIEQVTKAAILSRSDQLVDGVALVPTQSRPGGLVETDWQSAVDPKRAHPIVTLQKMVTKPQRMVFPKERMQLRPALARELVSQLLNREVRVKFERRVRGHVHVSPALTRFSQGWI